MNIYRAFNTLTTLVLTALPSLAFAGGGTPIQQAADNGLTIAVGLGAAGCAAGVVACCAGGMMRNGALMAGGATAAVCGGAWAGAPDVVNTVIGQGGGFALAALVSTPLSVFQALLLLIGAS